MTDPLPAVGSPAARPGRVAVRLLGLVAVLLAVSAAVGFIVFSANNKPAPAEPPITGGSKPTEPVKPITVGGRPLFADWPKEKPDLVIVVSGQTHGYLSPCGCSRPQLGGLERRYNLIQGLKGMGWEVIGVDVGDVAPAGGKGIPAQNVKKYAYALRAMKEMGYVAVGLGLTEFQNNLMDLLGQFTVQNPNERPIVLAGNLVGGVTRDDKKQPTNNGVAREEYFKVPKARPLVEDVEVYEGKGGVTVGVVGMIAPSVARTVVETDGSFDFEPVKDRLTEALKRTKKEKADLTVLLYQGSEIEAKQIAKDFPEVGLIVRASGEGEGLGAQFATRFPENNPTASIVHTGDKGQRVGVVGVFKTDKGVELRYQLVELGEEYLTPEKVEVKDHKLLDLLEQYTAEVKKDDLLKAAVVKKKDHPAQAAKDGLTYIGSEGCVKCHAAEVKKWGETKHAHAYEALEKVAKRPALRQYDPDCVSCHSTGFAYKTGFESGAKTPALMHNQCENCHGPGSGHAKEPKDKELLALLAPWKSKREDKIDKALMEKMAALSEDKRGQVQVPAAQQRLKNALSGMCMQCHDLDNDPKFDLWTYLPKIYHSGLKNEDLPPGVGK